MNRLTTFVKEFPNGRQALAARAGVEVTPAAVAEALELSAASSVLLLSGGAGLMPDEALDRLSAPFEAIGEVLAQEHATVIDGGTRAGVMALMGAALARTGRTAPYIGVLPAQAEVEPGGLRGEDILEPHHSHFVLLESDQWGAESKLMSDLATHLAGGAPSLALLVNGGEIALQDVEWNVGQGREIVVLAGSGRLADEIAQAVRETGDHGSALAGLRRFLGRLFKPNQRQRRIAAIAREGHITLFDLSGSPAELAKLIRQRLTRRE
jgi:hypothetical protein